MPKGDIDWSILPKKWDFLRDPAQKYGAIVWTDGALEDARQNISTEELDEFIELARLIRSEDGEHFSRWIDEYPITKHAAARHIYYLLKFLHACVPADLVPYFDRPGSAVDQYINDLRQHGSYRLASGRMWAARMLPDEGDDAKRAIPALRECLKDDDLRVQVQVHYALAILEGDVELHKSALIHLKENHPGGADAELVGLAVATALQRLGEPQSTRNLRAFGGFCITGSLANLQRLAGCVDINARDHNGQTPLGYAIGNDHAEVVEFLLKQGADPNLAMTRNGVLPVLDAIIRENPAIVKLLLEYGARPDARDGKGNSAIKLASHVRDREARVLILHCLRNPKG